MREVKTSETAFGQGKGIGQCFAMRVEKRKWTMQDSGGLINYPK